MIRDAYEGRVAHKASRGASVRVANSRVATRCVEAQKQCKTGNLVGRAGEYTRVRLE
jgi:hypothetical protein